MWCFRDRTWLALVPSCCCWRVNTLAENATCIGVRLASQNDPERPEHTLLLSRVRSGLFVANVKGAARKLTRAHILGQPTMG
jgi:hypothetical protein